MILTNCAACAAPLAHTAPRCVRCWTRYCEAQRVLGKRNQLTLLIGAGYAVALYQDPGATLADLREAVATLEEVAPTGRRVLGGAHSLVVDIERCLRDARATLRERETRPPSPTAWVVGGGALTYATTAADPREGVVADAPPGSA